MLRNLLLSACVAASLVASGATADSNALIQGDSAAGSSTYAASCAACHGPAGNSIVAAQPILAGQHAEYTADQLRMYASGERPSVIMAPLSQVLSDEDIDNISVYLASQRAGLSGAVDQDKAQAGQSLYRLGRAADAIPSCTGCHGPAGIGIPPQYPRLSGQHAEYTIATLREFANGTRVHAVMNEIAQALSEEDIANLAEYIAGQY